jgi:hypothetical protein
VIFCEDEPYFKNSESINNSYENHQIRPPTIHLDDLDFIPNINYEHEAENEEEMDNNISNNNNNDDDDINNNNNNNNNEEEDTTIVRRTSRIPIPSTRLRGYEIYTVQYPIQDFVSYENISPEYHAFLASIHKEEEPNNYQEAITKPVWCNAMKEELRALEKNDTWVIVQLPKK